MCGGFALTFRKHWWVRWLLLSTGGLFLCVALSLSHYFGRSAVEYVCLALPFGIAFLAFWAVVDDVAEITLHAEYMEIQKLFSRKSIKYSDISDVKKYESNNTITLVGPSFKVEIGYQFFLDEGSLKESLNEKLRVVPAPTEIYINGLANPNICVVGPIVVYCMLLVVLTNPITNIYAWMFAAIILIPFFYLCIITCGISNVTSQSVRQDPILGKRRELLYTEMEKITIHPGSEKRAESMCITGNGSEIWFNARFTPRYDQVLELILSYATCPVESVGLELEK